MNTVKALHTISGQVGFVPARYIGHPVLGKYLVAVEDEAKPYAPALYKPKDADEFSKTSRRGRKARQEAPEVPVVEEQADADADAFESTDSTSDED